MILDQRPSCCLEGKRNPRDIATGPDCLVALVRERGENFHGVLHALNRILDCHQDALLHFLPWPRTSPTRAPRGSGFGTGSPLRAWRAFRFRRTDASRISRVPGWRPHDSSRSSRGRAPQPSRSIRIHRNARCEPRRCVAASPFSQVAARKLDELALSFTSGKYGLEEEL